MRLRIVWSKTRQPKAGWSQGKVLKAFLMTACQRPIVLAAIKVALVVGTILNLINQGQLQRGT
jgi:hypothetical protein